MFHNKEMKNKFFIVFILIGFVVFFSIEKKSNVNKNLNIDIPNNTTSNFNKTSVNSSPAKTNTDAVRKVASSQKILPDNREYDRKIKARIPADVSGFKKQIKKKLSPEKIKDRLSTSKLKKIGTVMFSTQLRAEIFDSQTTSDLIGSYNDFAIYTSGSNEPLNVGHYFVAYDTEKNTVAFATGRFILEVTDEFNEIGLKNMNLYVAEKPSEESNLLFVESNQKSPNYEKNRLSLSKLPGVRSVRLEIIYGRVKQQ